MFISTRYLFRQLFFTTIFILILFSITLWLSQSLRFIEYVVQKGLKLTTLFALATLTLPEMIAVLLPFCFLIGTIFVYNKSESDHELIVLRSVGASPATLIYPIFTSGLIFSLVLAGFTLFIIPSSLEKFQDITQNIKNRPPSFYIQDRQFLSFGHITVYVRRAINGQRLQGLLIHDSKENSPSVLVAEEGDVFRVRDKIHLTLYEGQRFETDKKTGKPIILKFDQYDVDILEPETKKSLKKISVHQMSNMSLIQDQGKLFPYLRALSELHKRISTPFLVLLFGLTAAVIILGGDYHRKKNQLKLIAAFVPSLVIQIGIMMVLNAGKRHIFWLYLLYMLMATIFAGCLYLLRNPMSRILMKIGV